MSDKITSFYTPEDVDLPKLSLDLTRNTAVIIHRSTRVEQEPSLFVQEQLVSLAKKLRGEETDEHILIYTEELVSERQAPNLLENIINGLVGSIIAGRPDRLLRSKNHLFVQGLRKQHITVIIPGKRVYDFGKEEDLQAFQMEMQEEQEYIASHIKHMHATRVASRDREIN